MCAMKIVLAYSGGLDTSVLLSWIKEKYNAEMIAFCANIGQEDELRRPRGQGAAKPARRKSTLTICRRNSPATSFIPSSTPARFTRANTFSAPASPGRSSPSAWWKSPRRKRPTPSPTAPPGKGNDQVRFELTAAALAPDLQVIAPWRDARYRNEFPGRQEMIDYCAKNKIPVQASAKKPFSMRPEPPAHFLRGRHSRRPVDGRQRQEISRLVHHALGVSRRRAEQTGIRHA